jgi:hypothetical protein
MADFYAANPEACYTTIPDATLRGSVHNSGAVTRRDAVGAGNTSGALLSPRVCPLA